LQKIQLVRRYKAKENPLLKCKLFNSINCFAKRPIGIPVAFIDFIFPSESSSGGLCPALHIFIRLGKETYKTIHFLQNDGLLPFKDKSFDITICSDFIEHVSEIPKYLQEIRRVSKFILFKIPIESCGLGIYSGLLAYIPSMVKIILRGISISFKGVCFGDDSIKTVLHSPIFFEITPLMILYHHVSKLRIYFNPLTYLGIFSRIISPTWYLTLMGGNLFAFCKA